MPLSLVLSAITVPATPTTKYVLGAKTRVSSTPAPVAETGVEVPTIVPSNPEDNENVLSKVVVAYGEVALANVHVVAVEEAVVIWFESNMRVEVAEGDLNAQGVVVAKASFELLYSCDRPFTAKYGEKRSGPVTEPNC